MGRFCCPALPGLRLPIQLGSERHFVIVGTCTISPITVNHAGQKQRLYTSVEPISPPQLPSYAKGFGGQVVEAPGTAPGSGPLITRAFIAIAGQAGKLNIVPGR